VQLIDDTSVPLPRLAVRARRATADDLARLYRERGTAFAAVAAGICGPAAPDAVQDAFERALRRVGTYRARGSLEAWVWRVVVNEACRHARRRMAAPTAEGAGERQHHDPPPVDERVRAFVAALPTRQRAVVFLRYYADLDEATIARTLSIRRGTVAATLHRVHARLRTVLSEEER
jgi:RNA polymerase sigma factor (sigma-70 family)